MAKTYKNFRKNKKHISKRRNNKKAKRSTYKKKKIVGGVLEVCSEESNTSGCAEGINAFLMEILKAHIDSLTGNNLKPPYDFVGNYKILLDQVETRVKTYVVNENVSKEKASNMVYNEFKNLTEPDIHNNPPIFDMKTILQRINIPPNLNKNDLNDEKYFDNDEKYFDVVKKEIKSLFPNDSEIMLTINKMSFSDFNTHIQTIITSDTKPQWKHRKSTGGALISILLGIAFVLVLGAWIYIKWKSLSPSPEVQALYDQQQRERQIKKSRDNNLSQQPALPPASPRRDADGNNGPTQLR
jgi:ABC-type antimicrobial peptide transport system permease subunit